MRSQQGPRAAAGRASLDLILGRAVYLLDVLGCRVVRALRARSGSVTKCLLLAAAVSAQTRGAVSADGGGGGGCRRLFAGTAGGRPHPGCLVCGLKR